MGRWPKFVKSPLSVVVVVAVGISVLTLRPQTEAVSQAPPVLLPPQVEFVATLHSAADITPKPGFLKRIVKKVIGLDDRQKAMLMPQGVAVDPQGRILIADTKERVLHVFDPAKQRYRTFHPPDSDPFLAPIAVATDAQGCIYVSDSLRSRVFRFSPEGKYLGALGAIDKNESIFKRSTGLAVDPQRERLYVVDTVAAQVVSLTLDGKVIRRIGKRGDAPGEFNYPTHIAVAPDGSLWVMDTLNFRVQHLDSNGAVIASFGQLGDALGDFDKPKGIALDSQGHVYVTEARYDRVQVYDPSGRLLFFFGHTGNANGEFFLPAGIAVDQQNKIYVADGHNQRVQIFHLRPEAVTAIAGGQ